MTTRNLILSYLQSVEEILKGIDSDNLERIIDVVYQAWKEERQIFLVGNGGGAATAMHFSADLNKTAIVPGKKRMKARSLADNVSLMTAWANDTHYTNIFGEQLINFASPGDLVIGFTASGMSPNIVNAIAHANEMGLTTIAFVGFDGGTASAIAHHVLHIPSKSYQHIEDVHLLICHAITSALQDRARHDPTLGAPAGAGDDLHDRLRGVYYVRKALGAEKALDRRITMIPELVVRTVGFDAAILYAVEESGTVRMISGHNIGGLRPFCLDDDLYETQAVRERRAISVAENGANGKGSAAGLLTSYAVAPIQDGDKVVALVAGGYTNGRRITGSDVQLLQILAFNLRGALAEGEANLPGGGWWSVR